MNTLRPYEQYLQMCTQDWLKIEAEPIEIGLLIPTQTHIIEGAGDSSYCGDDYPHVVLFEGKYYLSDGHNRTYKRHKEGQKYIMARIKRLSYATISFINTIFDVKEKPC